MIRREGGLPLGHCINETGEEREERRETREERRDRVGGAHLSLRTLILLMIGKLSCPQPRVTAKRAHRRTSRTFLLFVLSERLLRHTRAARVTGKQRGTPGPTHPSRARHARARSSLTDRGRASLFLSLVVPVAPHIFLLER